MTQEQINYMKEKLIKLKKEDMSGKMTMGEYLTEIILISNIYVQEVNKAILPLSDATEPIAVAALLYLAKTMKTQMSAEAIDIAERIEKLMESSFAMRRERKKTLSKSVFLVKIHNILYFSSKLSIPLFAIFFKGTTVHEEEIYR